MQKKKIFIDEFGNAHLNFAKKGTFSHFVYASVIIDEQNIEAAHKMRDLISKRFFQGQAIKSSSISNDNKGFDKRLEILELLNELEFTVIGLVVNKKKLDKLGIERKDVFYKYFSKVLIKQFPKIFGSFYIYADKLGYPEFQADLKNFINNQVTQRDLFNPERFYTLVDEKEEEPLVQLADFIAGCLGKIYCTSHAHERQKELFDLLYQKVSLDFYPYERTDYNLGIISKDQRRDNFIKKLAQESATDVLSTRKRSLSKETIIVLEYLYLIHRSAPSRLIKTSEIIERVQKESPTYTKANFRQSIQILRDFGVIISSIQGQSGYKLPDRLEDIIGFYKRYMDSIIPMISRIDHCNKKLVFNGILMEEILVTDSNFTLLKALINEVNKHKILSHIEV